MLGLVPKKDIINKLEYIENSITEWENIWGNSKDENVRITITNTLNNINGLVKMTKEYFKGCF